MNLTKLKYWLFIAFSIPSAILAQNKVIDHRHTDFRTIPLEAIQQAKDSLHIGFGLTSHGSQLLSGNGAGDFGINQLRGVSGVFQTAQTPVAGALHLFQGAAYDDNPSSLLVGDAGWDAQSGNGLRFVRETRQFLGSPNAQGRGSSRPQYNVIIWSWCGQVSWHGDETFNHYFTGMDSLQKEYPGVVFVYMTGHTDGTGSSGQLHLRNERIRKWAADHNSWLYDFADMERFDPNGIDYLNLGVNDATDYNDGNWSNEWTRQNPTQVNNDIVAAHTSALQGQIKTGAAWWLFARLAGWQATTPVKTKAIHSNQIQQPQHHFDYLGRTITSYDLHF